MWVRLYDSSYYACSFNPRPLSTWNLLLNTRSPNCSAVFLDSLALKISSFIGIRNIQYINKLQIVIVTNQVLIASTAPSRYPSHLLNDLSYRICFFISLYISNPTIAHDPVKLRYTLLPINLTNHIFIIGTNKGLWEAACVIARVTWCITFSAIAFNEIPEIFRFNCNLCSHRINSCLDL